MMTKLAAGCTALVTLAACVEEPAPVASATMPTTEEQACLRSVSAATGNGDVVLVSSDFSQAGTNVIVGVGPQRAQWSCIGYSDGTTADITSRTDEGAL